MAKAKKKPAAKLKKTNSSKVKKVASKVKKTKIAKKVKKTTTPKKAKPLAKPVKTNVKLVDVSNFVTPLDDRIVVQVREADRMTPGGLIIPDTVTDVESYREGVVVAVGRGHRDLKGRLRPMDVRKGDKIMFAAFAVSNLQYQDANLVILRETDVMGVIS